MLPLRLLDTSRVLNEDKSISAVNFHGVSGYDSADILVAKDNKIFLIDNIWSYIEGDLAIAKILPTKDWHWMRFVVKSIKKNKLICQFRGQTLNPNLYVEKTFSIFIDIDDGVMKVRVAEEK